ncbi:hypothetical protein ABZY14_38730 [Streptomyces sp. NPDC006617]|uniref:hypothetical protein n=1 Tax=Streptomyces sp. NPDC006617 TaxID=3155354 RepID=UPI0033AB58D8
MVYGVFVAGWYLGQPVTPECHVDQAALDRAAERYRPEPSPSAYPDRSALADAHTVQGRMVMSLTYTSYAVACTNDMGERPRLRAWFDGGWE